MSAAVRPVKDVAPREITVLELVRASRAEAAKYLAAASESVAVGNWDEAAVEAALALEHMDLSDKVLFELEVMSESPSTRRL